MKTPKGKQMGRPKKPDAFDANFNFPCHKGLLDAMEKYRIAHGLRSKGEVVRQVLTKALGAK